MSECHVCHNGKTLARGWRCDVCGRTNWSELASPSGSPPPKVHKPNYAPVYAAAMYPELAGIFNRHGYALAVHGSLARDFDLIAVPWGENPAAVSTPAVVLKEVTTTFAVSLIGLPERKKYGRLAYTISVGWGECAIDLSFIALDNVCVEAVNR